MICGGDSDGEALTISVMTASSAVSTAAEDLRLFNIFQLETSFVCTVSAETVDKAIIDL